MAGPSVTLPLTTDLDGLPQDLSSIAGDSPFARAAQPVPGSPDGLSATLDGFSSGPELPLELPAPLLGIRRDLAEFLFHRMDSANLAGVEAPGRSSASWVNPNFTSAGAPQPRLHHVQPSSRVFARGGWGASRIYGIRPVAGSVIPGPLAPIDARTDALGLAPALTQVAAAARLAPVDQAQVVRRVQDLVLGLPSTDNVDVANLSDLRSGVEFNIETLSGLRRVVLSLNLESDWQQQAEEIPDAADPGLSEQNWYEPEQTYLVRQTASAGVQGDVGIGVRARLQLGSLLGMGTVGGARRANFGQMHRVDRTAVFSTRGTGRNASFVVKGALHLTAAAGDAPTQSGSGRYLRPFTVGEVAVEVLVRV
ncbi:MAG: hypothetical protein ACRC0L_02195, partial [Angustibacter sp.]